MWIEIIEDESTHPPLNVVLLVFQDFHGRCLRVQTSQGVWYDENKIYDYSELGITHWQHIDDEPQYLLNCIAHPENFS